MKIVLIIWLVMEAGPVGIERSEKIVLKPTSVFQGFVWMGCVVKVLAMVLAVLVQQGAHARHMKPIAIRRTSVLVFGLVMGQVPVLPSMG